MAPRERGEPPPQIARARVEPAFAHLCAELSAAGGRVADGVGSSAAGWELSLK